MDKLTYAEAGENLNRAINDMRAENARLTKAVPHYEDSIRILAEQRRDLQDENARLRDELERTIRERDRLSDQHRWRRVVEEVPDNQSSVQLATEDEIDSEEYWYDAEFGTFNDTEGCELMQHRTHWRPWPEPPGPIRDSQRNPE